MNASTMQQVQFIYVSDTVEQVKKRHFENGVDYSILSTYTYNSSNHNLLSEKTTMRDGSEVSINYEYGPDYNAGYLTRIYQSVKNVDGTTQTLEQKYTYDFNTGDTLTYTDGRQNTTEYQYDGLHRLRYVINPANPTVKTKKELVYDDSNNTVTQINEMGNQLRNVYDRLGRLLKTQSYENNAWVTLSENHYNALGLIDWMKDAAGNQTLYQYDAFGRTVKVTNPDSTYKQIVYKDAWIYEGGTNLVQTIDEDNRSTWTYTDKNGLQTSVKAIDTERYQYDDVGNLIQYTDNKGNVTTYTYDDLNRLIQVKNALSEITAYTYDNLNRLTSTTFPDGSTRQVRYDEASRAIEKTDETGNKEKLYYDLSSNLDLAVDLNGQTHDYVYDKHNQLTSVTSSSNGTTQTKSFTYNDAGQQLTASNNAGTWNYQYRTDNGDLKRVTYPDGKYVEIEDQKTASQYMITDPFGLKSYYKNNTLGQLDYVSLNADYSTLEADYSYTANGKLDTIVYPNGTKQDFDYFPNDGNQLQKVKHLTSSGTVLNEYSYDYDPNFNTKTIVEGTMTSSFDYDKLNRIRTSTEGAEAYTYDTRGNRLTLQSNNPVPVSEVQYEYDKWNQLSSVTKDGATVTYKYDPNGLMYERTIGETKTRYYYFNSDLIAEGTVNADGSVTKKASYIRGFGLIARIDASGEKFYYLTNGHGDIVEMRSSSGGVVNKYKYSIWGTVTNIQETVPNSFKYAGEFWDDATGLQYLRARWYDPSIGRFINKDTYEGQVDNPLTLNLYTYVANNPMRYYDPTGNCFTRWLGSKYCKAAWNWTENKVSEAYETLKSKDWTAMLWGSMQVVGGITEMAAGAALATGGTAASGGVAGVVTIGAGIYIAADGLSNITGGASTFVNGWNGTNYDWNFMKNAYQDLLGDDLGGKLYNGSQIGIGLVAIGSGLTTLPKGAATVSGFGTGANLVANGAKTVTSITRKNTIVYIDTYTQTGVFVKSVAIDLKKVGGGTLLIFVDGSNVFKATE